MTTRESARGDTIFVDVREPQEANLGMIPGATFIHRGNLESNGCRYLRAS